MFGCYWKLGQIENVFSVDCKIRATGRKIFFVVIFTSNHFRRRAKRERGRERTHKCANTERERAPSNPRSRRSDRRPHPLHVTMSALFIQTPPRSHTSTPAPARSIHIQELRSLLHELRSTWPTHARSLSFSIYLSLSLTCRSLSLPPSLHLTEILVLTNVFFLLLFGFILIFVCLKFIYWNFLLWNLFGSWENGWENVRN